ncbi:MAG: aspartate:alanine exchanger family transporter [Anaerolineae bacterium]|nr:transporter [Caldilineales bacterium]MDW8269080.1 aspartate:alanine exchanger family transporter [Anaerolineae bacterium]
MIDFLVSAPLLLLFLTTAIGYLLGRFQVKGVSLGVAAVLFVGLAVGALDPRLKLPEGLFDLGLVVFMYTIGLSSGPGFVAMLRRKGVRDNLLALAVLVFAGLLAFGLGRLLRLPAPIVAGLFTGSLTNTPALAGVLDTLQRTAPAGQLETLLTQPTVGYSIAYPMGVLGMITVILVCQLLWRIDYEAEAKTIKDLRATSLRLHNRTLRVTRPDVIGLPLAELTARYGWDVVFGRMQHEGKTRLADGSTRFAPGDLVSVIGTEEEIARVAAALGEMTDIHLELDRSEYDFRRVFVSNPRVIGQRLRDLNLPQQFGAIVTRVRRGDIEFLPHGDTVLEPGDRVRVVARPEHMEAVSKFFGDSYRELSEIDMLSFGLGLTIGLLLGLAPLPLPGGGVFRLGLAAGPLLSGLILGARVRTGPIIWQLPYSANLILRQVGLMLLLASIGLRSGHTFITTLVSGNGWQLFLAGAAITVLTGLVTLVVGYHLLKIPMGLLTGILGGIETQPSVLGFALAQARNELPNIGYATVFPLATIAKIIIAQILLALV